MKAKKDIFLVPGYGVPKDIRKDANYSRYLQIVANAIFDRTASTGVMPTVIFSGGPTDCWKPYRRTEANEMLRWFVSEIQSKDFRRQFRGWNMKLESRSLSTLENLLNSQSIIRRKSAKDKITIFTEATRLYRWKKLVRATHLSQVTVVPVDFDSSANRYRTNDVHNKEQAVAAFDLWALRSVKNLRQHHRFFLRRLKYLRAAGPKNHVTAARRFWTDGVTFLPLEIATSLRKYLA